MFNVNMDIWNLETDTDSLLNLDTSAQSSKGVKLLIHVRWKAGGRQSIEVFF